MQKILKLASKTLVGTSFIFASLAVNTTCVWRYYQEELDEQTSALKKFEA